MEYKIYDYNQILNEVILDFNYYLGTMSMFLKESYGIKDRFKNIYYNLLTSINDIEERYLKLIHEFILQYNIEELLSIDEFKDIYIKVDSPNNTGLYHYFEYDNDNKKYVLTEDTEIDEDKNYFIRSNKLIEQLCDLAGINREINVNDEIIILTSYEMIVLARLQFCILGYDGSCENLNEMYNKIFDKINIYYITTDTLTVSIIAEYNNLDLEYFPNLEKVLKTGDYFIKSLGIRYNINTISNISNLFTFRSEPYTFILVTDPDDDLISTYYEKDGDNYVLTSDTSLVQGKDYYVPETYNGYIKVAYPVQEDISNYYEATYTAVANPVQEDLDQYYELVGSDYIKTQDIEIDPNKTYYTASYSQTTDEEIDPAKSYYEKNWYHDYFDDNHSLLL